MGVNTFFLLVGVLVVGASVGVALFERRFGVLSEPVVATLAGMVVGPHVLGLVDFGGVGVSLAILEQVAPVAIALSVMGIALRLPKDYFREHALDMAVLIGVVLFLSALVSGGIAAATMRAPLWVAAAVGAAVAPTDPLVASAIVTGEVAERNVPARLRNLISAESGVNDGAAFPLLFLPVLFLQDGGRGPRETLVHWALFKLLLGVVGAVALGAAAGWGVGKVQTYAERKDVLERMSAVSTMLGLSLLVLGAVALLGSDGILAVFVAGVVFQRVAPLAEEEQQFRSQLALNRFFNVPVFLFFGIDLPLESWRGWGWHVPALVAGVLLLRRIPALLALRRLLPSVEGVREALFVGWFGPIGAAAVFWAAVAVRETGRPEIWTAVSAIVAASLLAHSATSPWLIRAFGEASGYRGRPKEGEEAPREEEDADEAGGAGEHAADQEPLRRRTGS